MTMKKNDEILSSANIANIENLYRTSKYRRDLRKNIVNTVFMLMVIAAFAILTSVLFFPILRIYGKSMSGTLDAGDLIVSFRTSHFDTGDIVAFYYNNNVLVKRVIAEEGDWVDMDSKGNVYVNQKKLSEPYLKSKDYGETNITFPYQVPEGQLFVMGDNRKVSIDSRNTSIGTVSNEQVVGKLLFKIWPLSKFRLLT